MKATKAQRESAVNYIGNALIRLSIRDAEQAVKHLTLALMTLSPDEPEPEKVECDGPVYHEEHTAWFRYCPRCGVALTTEGA